VKVPKKKKKEERGYRARGHQQKKKDKAHALICKKEQGTMTKTKDEGKENTTRKREGHGFKGRRENN